MADVSPNDRDMEVEFYVGRLQVRERFSWNQQWFLTFKEDL